MCLFNRLVNPRNIGTWCYGKSFIFTAIKKNEKKLIYIIEKILCALSHRNKKTVFIKNMSFQNFEVLQNLKVLIGHDGLLCSVNAPLPISKKVDAIPNWIHLKFKLLTSIITKS